MAVQLDPSGKDDKNDIKTHFVTREGVYRILNLSSEEFAVNPARPRPVGYQSNQSSPQVRVSIVSLPSAPAASSSSLLSSTVTAAAVTTTTTGAGSSSTTSGTNTTTTAAGGAGQQSVGTATSPVGLNCTSSTTGSTLGGTGGGGSTNGHQLDGNGLGGDRICFNIGKELYVYSFKGIRKVSGKFSRVYHFCCFEL